MTLPADDDRLNADVALCRAATERERARRAGTIARRHEQLAEHGPTYRHALHAETAALHRRLEQRHLTAAALHARHALLLERWAAGTGQPGTVRPGFISSVAGSVGAASAALSLLAATGAEALVIASDQTARAAQDLEFVLAEGPSRDASRGGVVVAAGGDGVADRWPRYGPALARLGMRAVASAPLVLEGRCLGALTVLDPSAAAADALGSPLGALTDTLIHTVLLTGEPTDTGLPDSPLLDGAAELRAVVHQAAGMVSVQNDCTITDALDLIRARAFAEDRPIDEISAHIVDRTLHLG